MKINFKQGIRRIVYSIVGLGIAFALFNYILGGCIFDNSKFVYNTAIYKQNAPEKQLNLVDFANEYLKNTNDLTSYWAYDFECHPYKKYCKFKNITFNANKNNLVEIENFKHYTNESLIKLYKNGEKAKAELYVSMPSPMEYFKWQIQDLFAIVFISAICLLLYFLFEFILCWIIKGFKE